MPRKPKPKHGGRRPGAGRPVSPTSRTAQIKAQVTPDVRNAFAAIARQQGQSISEAAAEAIELAIARGSTR